MSIRLFNRFLFTHTHITAATATTIAVSAQPTKHHQYYCRIGAEAVRNTNEVKKRRKKKSLKIWVARTMCCSVRTQYIHTSHHERATWQSVVVHCVFFFVVVDSLFTFHFPVIPNTDNTCCCCCCCSKRRANIHTHTHAMLCELQQRDLDTHLTVVCVAVRGSRICCCCCFCCCALFFSLVCSRQTITAVKQLRKNRPICGGMERQK